MHQNDGRLRSPMQIPLFWPSAGRNVVYLVRLLGD